MPVLSKEDIDTLLGFAGDSGGDAPRSMRAACPYAIVKDNAFAFSFSPTKIEGQKEESLADRVFADVTTLRASGGEKLRPAMMSRGEDIWSDDYFRGDSLCWITPELVKEYNLSGIDKFIKKIKEEIEPLRNSLGLNDDCSVQFAVYPGKGEGYNRHKDAFPKSSSASIPSSSSSSSSSGDVEISPPRRQLTCLFYLNKEWEPEDGGQLRVFTPAGALIEGGGVSFNFWGCNGFDIEPLFGRFVIFRSEIVEHAVLPCYRERVAITVWITGVGPVDSEVTAKTFYSKEESIYKFSPTSSSSTSKVDDDDDDGNNDDDGDDNDDNDNNTIIRHIIDIVHITGGDLVVHGTDGPTEGELICKRLVTEEVVETLVKEVLDAQGRGDCPPLAAIAFCHLLPSINGRVLQCILPLISPAIEDINLDCQPCQVEEVRSILTALNGLSFRKPNVSISLIRCGVPRGALIEGFSAMFIADLTIFIDE